MMFKDLAENANLDLLKKILGGSKPLLSAVSRNMACVTWLDPFTISRLTIPSAPRPPP
jgi:hypothetical protein